MKVKVTKVPGKSSEKTMKVKVKAVPNDLPKGEDGPLIGGKNVSAPSWYDWNKGFSQPVPPNLTPLTEATGNKVDLSKQDSYNINLNKQGKVNRPNPFYKFSAKTKDFFTNPKTRQSFKDAFSNEVPFYAGSVFGNIYSPNPYFTEGFQNLSTAINTASTIGKPYYYNPNYNMYFGRAEHGMMLPKAENGPMVGGYAQKGYFDFDSNQNEEPEFRVGDEGYYEAMGRQKQYPIENVKPMGYDSLGNISERATSMNPTSMNSTPMNSTPNLQPTDKAGNVLKGVYAGVKAIEGAQDLTKGFLKEFGVANVKPQIQAFQAQRRRENLFTEYQNPEDTSTMMGMGTSGSNSLDGRSGYDQAAYGMQIRQIGGMGDPNVEVEGDEHIQLPNGFSQEIKGKTHAEGGIPLNLPQGTKIFSEKLKLTVKFIQELIQVNPEYEFLKNVKLPKTGSVSYADLAKKFETKKYMDILNSNRSDSIQKGTAKMIIERNNQNLEKIFALQEQNKISGVHGPQVQRNAEEELAESQQQEPEESMMKYGGLYKAQNGVKTVTLPTGKTITAKRYDKSQIPSDYKPVPGMPGYYYKETETKTTGQPTTTTITSKAPGKGSADFNKAFAEARKAKLKEFTWNGRKYTTDLYKPTTQTITTPGQPIISKAEDYIYTEDDMNKIAGAQQQTPSKSRNMLGIDAGMPGFYIPQNYMEAPVVSYNLEFNPAQPERFNPYINDLQRAEFAANANLGTSGAEMANRANLFGQRLLEMGRRYHDANVANVQAANQFALQNQNLDFQVDQANRQNFDYVQKTQRDIGSNIAQQKQEDINSYLKALADRQHMRDMMVYAPTVYNTETAKELGKLYTGLNTLYAQQQEESTPKKSKASSSGFDCSSGTCVPISKYGGKINIKKKRNRK